VNEPFGVPALGKIDVRHANADVVEYPGFELRYIAERTDVLELTEGDKRQQPGAALGSERHKPGAGRTDERVLSAFSHGCLLPRHGAS